MTSEATTGLDTAAVQTYSYSVNPSSPSFQPESTFSFWSLAAGARPKLGVAKLGGRA